MVQEVERSDSYSGNEGWSQDVPWGRVVQPRVRKNHTDGRCAKVATYRCTSTSAAENLVQNVTKPGQNFSISLFSLPAASRRCHCVFCSPRSTCRRRPNRKGRGRKREGPRKRDGSFRRPAEFGPLGETAKGVEYLPSFGGPSDTGRRMVCLGNPEGRVSLGSLVTRGFRLFRPQDARVRRDGGRVAQAGKNVRGQDRS